MNPIDTVIVLAAGRGTRLSPLTDNLPKCMVSLCGRPLVEWKVDIYKRLAFEKIVLAKGYYRDKLRIDGTVEVFNPDFASTNMVATLFCAEEHFGRGFLLSYGDIIYNREIVEKVRIASGAVNVIIDTDWERYWRERCGDPLDDAETLKLDDSGRIVEIGKKPRSIDDIMGQYIGLLSFREEGIDAMREIYYREKTLFECEGRRGVTPERDFPDIYMTDMLQALIDEGVEVRSVPTAGGWLEIDTLADYDIAAKYTRPEADGITIQR